MYDKAGIMKNTSSPGCKSASCQFSKSLNEMKADASALQTIITGGSKMYGAIKNQYQYGFSSLTYL